MRHITLFLALFLTSSWSLATPNFHHTLANYLHEPEHIQQPLTLTSTHYDTAQQVTIETYQLASQRWPKPNGTLWKHTLVIYLPNHISTHEALLFVNGGTRNENTSDKNPPPTQLNFAHIANATHSVIANLQDVPNQYLAFDDHKPRKEDSIVAYTWNRFMDNPVQNQYWPIHLPMVKAIIKAMDATQQIVKNNHHQSITHFTLSGASKRGLAVWLAALGDKRVNAIIPIVIDILNTKKNIAHIYASYNNHWPPAFHNYLEEHILDRVNTPAFDQLMDIEDPASYLNEKQYRKRLSIPKFIICASGDDFFTPDSLNQYLTLLPGKTWVRVIPNQPHYVDAKVIEDAIISYYQQTPPSLQWEVTTDGTLYSIRTNRKPIRVIQWQANNPTSRDFRLSSNIHYHPIVLSGECKQDHCDYLASTQPPQRGWQANFIEATFQTAAGEPLVLTTSNYVSHKHDEAPTSD